MLLPICMILTGQICSGSVLSRMVSGSSKIARPHTVLACITPHKRPAAGRHVAGRPQTRGGRTCLFCQRLYCSSNAQPCRQHQTRLGPCKDPRDCPQSLHASALSAHHLFSGPFVRTTACLLKTARARLRQLTGEKRCHRLAAGRAAANVEVRELLLRCGCAEVWHKVRVLEHKLAPRTHC